MFDRILSMTRYKYELKLDFDFKPDHLVEHLVKVLRQTDVDVISISYSQSKPAGRPPKQDPKIDKWLRGRTKEFTIQIFAKYMESTPQKVYPKLQRMVARGQLVRTRRAGRVVYQVNIDAL